jgi:polysaccharide pyruvyl transferase WcaK-like protein
MKVVICRSRFADNNIGERFILSSILEKLSTYPDIHITVLSNSTELTEKIHGICVVDCSLQRFYKVFSAIYNSDLVLWGGGNMLQEQFSYLHIPLVAKDFLLAKLLGKKLFVYGVEVGPIISKMGKLIAGMILRNTDMVTVRNIQSYKEAKSLGTKNNQLILTEDPVFSISTDELFDKDYLVERFSLSGQKPKVGICPRILLERQRSYLPFQFRMQHGLLSDDFYYKQQQIKDFMVRVSRFLIDESDIQVIFLPMDINDEEFCDDIIEIIGGDCIKITLSSLDLKEVKSLFRIMDLVISMRLHGLILASCVAIPVMGISGVAKNTNFLSSLGCPQNNIDVDNLDFEKFKEIFRSIWSDREKKRQQIQEKVAVMKKREEQNFRALTNFLEKISSPETF